MARVKVDGNMVCNDGQVLHDLALAGKGLAWLSMWKIGSDIYAVFAQRRHLPLQIWVFVNFLRRAYMQTDYWSQR